MRTDILLDDDFDLMFENGDFATGSSAQQEVEQIGLSHPGEWKQFPIVGLGLTNYLKKVAGRPPLVGNVTKLIRDYRKQLNMDGFKDAELEINEDLSLFNINVEP